MEKLKLQNIKKNLRTKTDFLSLSETLTTSDKAELMDFLKTLNNYEQIEGFSKNERIILTTKPTNPIQENNQAYNFFTELSTYSDSPLEELRFKQIKQSVSCIYYRVLREKVRKKITTPIVITTILKPAPSTITGIER